jgi:DNA-binding protein Fis
MIAEIAALGSVGEVVDRLADTLHCPVALIGGPRPVLAAVGTASTMAEFPRETLRRLEHITVANEVADAEPALHALMRRHGVSAIVPYYPHSQTAASWLLLGESFSEQVYTRLDFKRVEELFARLSELFLDRLVGMRTQLADAQRSLRTLELRLQRTEENLAALRDENRALRDQSARLMDRNVRAIEQSVRPAAAEAPAADTDPAPVEARSLDDHVAEFEARIIRETLERCDGNKAQAARMLGLRPNTLHYKLERYGIAPERSRKG